MIPAFRTNGAGAAVYTSNNVANPSTLSPTKAAATQNGDLMVLFTFSRSITATCATPDGWTLIDGPLRSGTASGGTWYVYARIATGAAQDAPSVVWTGLTTGTSGDSCSAAIVAYQNAIAVKDGTSNITDASVGTPFNLPAHTTTKRSLIVAAAAKVYDSSSATITFATYAGRRALGTTSGTGHFGQLGEVVPAAAGTQAAVSVTSSYTTAVRTLAITVGLFGAPTAVTRADPGDIADETGAAVTLVAKKRVAIEPAGETGSAAVVKAAHPRTVAPAVETGTAVDPLSITHISGQHVSLPQVGDALPGDSNTALAVKAVKQLAAAAAAETDAAQAVKPAQQL
ncbi:MAG TPA: hypothetical protein VF731_07415, partial [Solirubrobacterales bacterium]